MFDTQIEIQDLRAGDRLFFEAGPTIEQVTPCSDGFTALVLVNLDQTRETIRLLRTGAIVAQRGRQERAFVVSFSPGLDEVEEPICVCRSLAEVDRRVRELAEAEFDDEIRAEAEFDLAPGSPFAWGYSYDGVALVYVTEVPVFA